MIAAVLGVVIIIGPAAELRLKSLRRLETLGGFEPPQPTSKGPFRDPFRFWMLALSGFSRGKRGAVVTIEVTSSLWLAYLSAPPRWRPRTTARNRHGTHIRWRAYDDRRRGTARSDQS